MKTWRIHEYAVLYLLWLNGFHYEQLRSPGPIGDTLYVTDLPIEDNGSIELPGGFVIRAIHGVELRAARIVKEKR